MEQKTKGFTCTNTSPVLFPTRSKHVALGTNPISVAAPAQNGDDFVLDMATSTVAMGKLEINNRKGLPIPLSWAADKNGNPTTNPKDVMELGFQKFSKHFPF